MTADSRDAPAWPIVIFLLLWEVVASDHKTSRLFDKCLDITQMEPPKQDKIVLVIDPWPFRKDFATKDIWQLAMLWRGASKVDVKCLGGATCCNKVKLKRTNACPASHSLYMATYHQDQQHHSRDNTHTCIYIYTNLYIYMYDLGAGEVDFVLFANVMATCQDAKW